MATKPLTYVTVPTATNTAQYVAPTYTAPTNTAVYKAQKGNVKYEAPEYASRYGDRLDAALNNVTNFSYDPMKDASYQALAKVYGERGNQAAKNSLADAAALNGGYGTSYAVSAAQQSRNQYNQELAALIPELEERAYNRNVQTLSALGEAEDRDYGRYRDTVGDAQWKYGVDYQKHRDTVADNQWKYTQDYQKYRDETADAQWKYGMDTANAQWKYTQDYQKYRDTKADEQWARNFNLDVYSLKKNKSGGGGGGRRGGGGGGGGYSGSGSSGGNVYSTISKTTTGVIKTANGALKAGSKSSNKSKQKTSNKSKIKGGNGGHMSKK